MFQNQIRKNILLLNQEKEEVVNNINSDYEESNENLHDSIFCTNNNKDDEFNNWKIDTDEYKNMISINSQQNGNVEKKLNTNLTNKKKQLSAKELEIMKIFTSPEWLNKPSPKSLVNLNLTEDKDNEANQESENNNLDVTAINNVTETNVYNNDSTEAVQEENSSIDENENKSYAIIPIESFDNLKLFIEEELVSENNPVILNENYEETEVHSDVLTHTSSYTEKISENIYESFEDMEVIKSQEREFSDRISYIEKLPENMSFESMKHAEEKDHKDKIDIFEELSCADKSSDNTLSESSKYTDKRESSEVLSCTDEPSRYTKFESFKISVIKNDLKSHTSSSISNENMILENQQSDNENQPKVINNEASSNEDFYRAEKQIRNECYSYREPYKREETFMKQNSEIISQISSGIEISITRALMLHLNIDEYNDTETIDSLSTMSTQTFNTTSIMAQLMSKKKSRQYVSKKQLNDDEFAINAAVRRIFENTKNTLGELLIEGLYQMATNNRQDPFGYLGKWLLIQADIIDENKIELDSLANVSSKNK